MEFVLLAAIFFTSAGFFVGGSAETTPPPTVAPAPSSESNGETAAPQLRAGLPGMNAGRFQQAAGAQS
ncbi:hypothetical protein PPMP20_28830 [Paraburkholderia phymatum]|uniref:hypothetical protein n=1 Tax=Paraburkholderia phymatum TaxID=148447 RepID=UPI00031C995B|nr:hypothetical protein [Paraburkholderia phymatum]